MRYILQIILSFLPLFFTGCQDETETLLPGTIRQAATFTAVQRNTDVATRATDQHFETGDAIGIYVVKKDGNTPGTLQPSGNYADNKHYVITDNGTLQPFGESDKIYFSSSETYDIYAYYPYSSSIDNPTNYYFTTKLDQTNKQNYTRSDLMTAHSVNNSNSAVIPLIFERKFGLVEIHFSKVPGKTVTAATINSVKTTVILNLNTGTTTYNNNTYNIKMSLHQENANYYIFRAILPVQELQGNYLFDFTINGETIQYKAKSVTPLAAGEKSLYLLNLQYHIKAYHRDSGTGYVTGAEKEIFNHGETVNLMAYPAAGYRFAGWFESPLIGWQPNLKKVSDTPNYLFTATQNIWMIAVFEENGYLINVNNTVGGSVLGAGTYQKNTTCTLTAITAKGYTFGGWYDVNDNLLTNNLTYAFTVTENRTLKCTFIPNDNTITVWRDWGVEVTGNAGSFKTGSTCTLTAKMTDKYKGFNGYFYDKECTQLITTSEIYNFIVNENRTIYTKSREITHFNFNNVYWFRHGMESTSQTTLIDNEHEYQSYTATLKAGEKARYESVLVWNESPENGDHHRNTMQITDKTLTIKQNGRIISTTNSPDNYIFTAPTAGNYEFIYTGRCQVTIYAGEKCAGYLHLIVALWKEETLK